MTRYSGRAAEQQHGLIKKASDESNLFYRCDDNNNDGDGDDDDDDDDGDGDNDDADADDDDLDPNNHLNVHFFQVGFSYGNKTPNQTIREFNDQT